MKQKQQLRNLAVGQKGEILAKNFLIKKRYQIEATNFRVGQHEIDIVAIDPQTQELVFVEVKTRSSSYFGNPSSAVNFRKQRALWRCANLYRKMYKVDRDYRFDVIAISPKLINHYQNVTW